MSRSPLGSHANYFTLRTHRFDPRVVIHRDGLRYTKAFRVGWPDQEAIFGTLGDINVSRGFALSPDTSASTG